MRKSNILLAAGAAALSVGLLYAPQALKAAGFFTNGVPVASVASGTLPLTGNETIPADTNLASGANPQSESITVGQLASGLLPTTPRNYLLNGDMAIAQRGTSAVTGGTTTVAQTAMVADRWYVDTNVTSGAGQGQVITATPSPPTGFQQTMKVFRNSGALLQPVCAEQPIESSRATQLAGKFVVASDQIAALAGLTATGNLVSINIITGTGTDQGLATRTATPAITPAWTGITTAQSTAFTTTTTFTRFFGAPVQIPSTATEVGVQICFTPVGASSGTTDGFAHVGAQLEVVPGTSTTSGQPGPSAFEFRPLEQELREAQRFFFRLSEPANTAAVNGICQATGANTNACTLPLPVPMRGTTPTITITTAGTFKVNIAGTPTTIATPTASVCSTLACTVTAANTNTAGQVELLTGGGGAGIWDMASDVVM